jgi:hypothetical protein
MSIMKLIAISLVLVFFALSQITPIQAQEPNGISGRYDDGKFAVAVSSVKGKRYFSGKVLGCVSKTKEKVDRKCDPSDEIEFWVACSKDNGINGGSNTVEVYMKGWTNTFHFNGEQDDGFMSDISSFIATDFCDKTIEGNDECDDCKSETTVMDPPIGSPKRDDRVFPKTDEKRSFLLKTSDTEVAGVRALVIAMVSFYQQKRPPFRVSVDDQQKIISAGIALDAMCNPNDPRQVPSEGHAAFCYYTGTLLENQNILGWLDFSLSTHSFGNVEDLENFYDRLDSITADAEKIGSVKFPRRK